MEKLDLEKLFGNIGRKIIYMERVNIYKKKYVIRHVLESLGKYLDIFIVSFVQNIERYVTLSIK